MLFIVEAVAVDVAPVPKPPPVDADSVAKAFVFVHAWFVETRPIADAAGAAPKAAQLIVAVEDPTPNVKPAEAVPSSVAPLVLVPNPILLVGRTAPFELGRVHLLLLLFPVGPPFGKVDKTTASGVDDDPN